MLVLVADRHPLFRDVLKALVAEILPAARCLEAATFADVMDVLASVEGVGLMLVDQSLPDADGLGGLVRLSIAAPDVPIMVFSVAGSRTMALHARVCGAAAFVSKCQTREEMLRAVINVLADGFHPVEAELGRRGRLETVERLDVLTVRERMVLEALTRGCSNKQIAYELQVSDTTVKVHVSSVLRKLRVHSRTQAVIKTRRTGEEEDAGAPLPRQV